MKRRNFLGNLMLAGASFMVLPGAGRLWKATMIPNPNYVSAEVIDPSGSWYAIFHNPDTQQWQEWRLVEDNGVGTMVGPIRPVENHVWGRDPWLIQK